MSPPAPELEHRLTELEIRSMHQEDLLQQLSDVVREQQDRIDALNRSLDALRSQVNASVEDDDSPPPHY
jgi:SlyX protein